MCGGRLEMATCIDGSVGGEARIAWRHVAGGGVCRVAAGRVARGVT